MNRKKNKVKLMDPDQPELLTDGQVFAIYEILVIRSLNEPTAENIKKYQIYSGEILKRMAR